MGGEAEQRFAARNHALVALRDFRRVGDDVGCGGAGRPATAEFVEMRELNGDPAEIVPHAGEYPLDLGVGFFRECGAQVVTAEAVFREQRAEAAHQRAGEVGRAAADPGA